MIYLIIAVAAIAVLLNLRASLLVVRAPFCEWQRKAIQLAFVWMIPVIGALTPMQVFRETEGRYLHQAWTESEVAFPVRENCPDFPLDSNGEACD